MVTRISEYAGKNPVYIRDYVVLPAFKGETKKQSVGLIMISLSRSLEGHEMLYFFR